MAKAAEPTDPEKDAKAKARQAARKAARAAADIRGDDAPAPDEQAQDGDLKLRDLVQAVVGRTEVKRPEARAAVEAALAVLGEAISAGRDVNLPGFGKSKVKRAKEQGNRRVIELRLRQDMPAAGGTDTVTERVADDDEES